MSLAEAPILGRNKSRNRTGSRRERGGIKTRERSNDVDSMEALGSKLVTEVVTEVWNVVQFNHVAWELWTAWGM